MFIVNNNLHISVDDLTPKEAHELEVYCDVMLSGMARLDHPMYLTFCDVAQPKHREAGSASIHTHSFLARALWALLKWTQKNR